MGKGGMVYGHQNKVFCHFRATHSMSYSSNKCYIEKKCWQLTQKKQIGSGAFPGLILDLGFLEII